MEWFHRGTLAEGHGSGLGLPIVEMALAKLGGRLEFVRTGNDGFCVRIHIPALRRFDKTVHSERTQEG